MPARRQRQPEQPTGAIDHYQRLGVARDAAQPAIRRAFRDLARKLHPDVNRAADAAARFAEIQTAYEVLSDAVQRKAYDRKLAGSEGPAPARSQGGHYSWANVASPGGGRAMDDDEFEDLWQTFFAARASEQGAAPASKPKRRKS